MMEVTLLRSRSGGLSRKGCVVNGQITKAGNKQLPPTPHPYRDRLLTLSSVAELPSDTSESHLACLSLLKADSLGRAALTSAIT